MAPKIALNRDRPMGWLGFREGDKICLAVGPLTGVSMYFISEFLAGENLDLTCRTVPADSKLFPGVIGFACMDRSWGSARALCRRNGLTARIDDCANTADYFLGFHNP